MRFSAVVLASLVLAVVRPPIATAGSSPDASTLRVFTVGTVGVDHVELSDGRSIAVADALAGHGTGFVIEAGLIMTAQHVVDGARHVVVRLPGDGGFFPARVVYADKSKDVAILVVQGALPPALAVGAEPPRVRSTVFAVGYPVDATRKQPQSARGIIAGFLDDGTVQLDMSLNPGNSGGPIVNEQDEVVGMAIARGAVDQGVQGIGYAVPVSMLKAAMEEAKRRLASGEAGSAAGVSRESATVVDELVQHGAFYELRKSTDLKAAPAADLDRALADVLARIQDADLLVFVASALWNVSLALEYVEPAKFELTSGQAFTLRTRLRESARRAVRRAIQLDGTVGNRSAFVALATAEDANATHRVGEAGPSRAHLLLQAAPIVRYNETTGSTGWGGGMSAATMFGRDNQEVMPLLGIAFGTVRVSNADGEFAHTLLAAQAGIYARFDDVDIAGEIEACVYSSSVVTSTVPSMDEATSTELALSGRVSIGYRLGPVVLGAAARMLGGPTLWIEPISAAARF